jgi:hypothetical protein
MNGYKDAYNAQKNALAAYKRIRDYHEQQKADALMFVFYLVSVGFAGGFVGGLVAPWVRKAGEVAFKVGVRSGVQEIAKMAAKEVAGAAVKKLEEATKSAPVVGSPYEPVTQETFDLYLDKKEQFDECFARYDKLIDQLQKQANDEQWPIETGWAIFRGFVTGCPVLRDKPDPDAVPDRAAVAKAAGVCMWVQWAEVRDWPWWNKQYDRLDAGPVFDPRNSGYWEYKEAAEYVQELAPILAALYDLGLGRDVQMFARTPWKETPGKGAVLGMMTDLRKLRKVKVGAVPDLPFAQMKALDFGTMTSPQLRGEFLDGLKDARPSFRKSPP